uniref:Superoxide dismutase (EC) n=1 Tax=Ganoderma boninense TaxID=34458 RepID=A0A5K1K6I7_9APHY|nr:Superoxide dismutase (EC [Ganoderma boninense]
MSVSKLPFIPFTVSNYADSQRNVYRSDRDSYRGELRHGLNGQLAESTGISDIQMPYSKEKYARLVVWCLRLMLDGWPWHIPFTNLSDIKGGAAPLRLLVDLLHSGTLRFIPAPEHVWRRALHDPDSVLPHVMAAAKLPPLPRTIQPLQFSLDRFRDLTTARGLCAPSSRNPSPRPCASRRRPAPAPAVERILDPRNLDPLLTAPIGPGSSQTTHERHQRCDTNKARHRPVSNPEGKPMRARKVGVLTSPFVLDGLASPGPSTVPAPRSRPMKPLSAHRLPLLVNDHLGGYCAPGAVQGGGESEVEGIDSDAEDEYDSGGHQAKRRRML